MKTIIKLALGLGFASLALLWAERPVSYNGSTWVSIPMPGTAFDLRPSGISGSYIVGTQNDSTGVLSSSGPSGPFAGIPGTGLNIIASATYVSGLSATGTKGQTCLVSVAGDLLSTDGPNLVIPLTGTNSFTGAVPRLNTDSNGIPYSGLFYGNSPPTTGAVSNGSATGCTGAPIVLTIVFSTPSGPTSYALGVNASGQVVGVGSLGGGAGGAFLFSGGTMTSLGVLGSGPVSRALAISDGGVITGCSKIAPNNPQWHAFVYASGTMTEINTAAWPGDACGFAVNASGAIAGIAGGELFKYSSGTATGLGQATRVGGINSSNVIVGAQGGQAFYYDTAFHAIPFLAGDTQSAAMAINDSGQIVGYGFPSHHPWMYTIGGSLTDLGLGGGWKMVIPTSISSIGSIVGFANF